MSGRFLISLIGKGLIGIFLLSYSHFPTYSQNVLERLKAERRQNRIENRKTQDPIYDTGDTLYLFYDPTDSLQDYRPSYPMVFWELRKMTPEEASNPDAPEYSDLFESEISKRLHLFPYYKYKPKILTFEELKKITLTSRKEFMDFYQREYQRKQGKVVSLGKEEKMILSNFDIRDYFYLTYMIIPQSNNTFKMYIIEGPDK